MGYMMIKLENAMVLWNSDLSEVTHPGSQRIAVVNHGDDNRALNFLHKSMGACWSGWKKIDTKRQAAHFMALFTQIVGRDGVPGKDAHAEFMKIEEYREWVSQGTGPFSDVYWAWSGATT